MLGGLCYTGHPIKKIPSKQSNGIADHATEKLYQHFQIIDGQSTRMDKEDTFNRLDNV